VCTALLLEELDQVLELDRRSTVLLPQRLSNLAIGQT
jgi:hypothetical protein